MIKTLLRQNHGDHKVQHHHKQAEIAIAGNHLGKHRQHAGKPHGILKEGEQPKQVLEKMGYIEVGNFVRGVYEK